MKSIAKADFWSFRSCRSAVDFEFAWSRDRAVPALDMNSTATLGVVNLSIIAVPTIRHIGETFYVHGWPLC